ncbi:MAG: 2'-5' RNA ligase [Cellulosilyticum sp.]|nr:2'-5' RNA ligase [Cellulosilyticum sp.]
MAYTAFITRIKNVRPHPNADRLQLGECFGNTIVISLDYEDNQLGIYFPSDGQLSVEFAEANNLLRKKDENGNNIGGYMDASKRNVTAIKLRGEKSDGLFLPLKSLESFGDVTTLHEGDRIDSFNGHEICCKYIPRRNHRNGGVSNGNRTRKKKVDIAPLFVEHADTEQLAYNLGAFKAGDEIEITLKMHGTSQRTAYLPVFKGYKRTLWDKICRKEGTPIYDWGYVSGTRRTVLENFEGGYYGSNEFREQHSKFFEGKLWKGEEVYYEVVGFTHTGTPIMATADNKKLNDKEFVKQYGKETIFSYGCSPTGKEGIGITERNVPQSDIYVYRMTMTNEDGDMVEYTPDFMRYRCEQMGVKTVPVMWKGSIDETIDWNDAGMTAGEWAKYEAEKFYDGPDPIGKTHVREGVVVRILNRPKFCAYKHKNFSFKVLEGICKAEAEAPDMEEAEEVAAE